MEHQPITLYTDGASSGNPGPGGYGAILCCGDLEKEFSGGFACTTNNRMELLAVITGLEAINWENATVDIYSDSSYVVKSVSEGWLFNWERKGFAKAKNVDLWQRFLAVYRRHNVTFHWIKGHAGHPYNERCDALAVNAGAGAVAAGITLPPDAGYEMNEKTVPMEEKLINKPLIIIGGTGHGSVIEACVNDNRRRFNNLEWEVKGYCNDYDKEIDGYPVLGTLNDIPRLIEEGYYFTWAIHLVARNYKTVELFEKCNIPDDRLATIVHETAFVDPSVQLSPGAFIMYNAYVGPRAKVGKCVMIKANTSIGHDTILEDLSHVAVSGIMTAYAHLGKCADLAVGGTMLAKTKIGDYGMLGAASLLTHDIPEGEIWVGSPAHKLKDMPKD